MQLSSAIVPFYSASFFDPDGNLKDGEVKNHKEKMIKILIKIAAKGNKFSSNMTSFEIKWISHFNNDVKQVLHREVHGTEQKGSQA